ncbi:unnamed protein product, partial [marine sediment metagenome]
NFERPIFIKQLDLEEEGSLKSSDPEIEKQGSDKNKNSGPSSTDLEQNELF